MDACVCVLCLVKGSLFTETARAETATVSSPEIKLKGGRCLEPDVKCHYA